MKTFGCGEFLKLPLKRAGKKLSEPPKKVMGCYLNFLCKTLIFCM